MSVMSTPEVTIGPAGTHDVPGVVELIGRVFSEYGFVWDPAAEVPDLFDFNRHYAGAHGAFWVARRDTAIVGSVGVERLSTDQAELHRLYVDPALRGRGVGNALVETVLAWCRSRKIRHLLLWSDTRFDRAHRLYQRMGFARTGARELPGDINETREYRYERPV
jgi:N-acetylglutamate synthase-like GNAT family acetyltransferase